MKKIAIFLRESGGNGGPHVSHERIIKSSLNEKYSFHPIYVPKGKLGLVNIKLTLFLIKELKRIKPDIVHIIGLELIGFHLMLASKIAGFHNIATAIHGSASESVELKKTLFKKWILHFLEMLTLKFSIASYGVSHYVGTIPLVKKFPLVHKGVIFNITKPPITNETICFSIRNVLNIAADEVVAVSVGRIEIEKGYKVLVDVIKNNKNEKLKFIIIGDGSYLDEMKRLLKYEALKDKVFLLGYRDDVHNILKECDVFVTASLHETFCMALAEASWAGLALVAPNVGGIPEIIINGKNGILVDDSSEHKISFAIDSIISNKDTLIRMKLEARKIAEVRFETRLILNDLDNFYRLML